MEINLLPKGSFFEKYCFLLITLPSLLLLALAIVFFVKMMELDAELATSQGELTSLTSENISLQAERTTDAKTTLFRQIQQAVHDVQSGEHNPGTILHGIATKLSDKTRVTTAVMDAESQKVTLTLESDSIDNIAEYTVLLRVEPWVKDALVQDIEQKNVDTHKNENMQENAGQPSDTGQDIGAALVKPPVSQVPRKPQQVAGMQKTLLPYKTQVIITLEPQGNSAHKSGQ